MTAHRLSEDPATSVLPLEAGGDDRTYKVQRPAALQLPLNDPGFNWAHQSEPEPQINNRRIDVPRRWVLSGSSSINSMVYLHGRPRDYEAWQELGAKGWSWCDVMPYFMRAEHAAHGDPALSRADRTSPCHAAASCQSDVSGLSEGLGAGRLPR